jgi:DNA invertase Pin-like site-specific DNA recombinase
VLKIVDPGITFDGTDVMAEAMLTLFGMIGRIEKHFLKARQRRGIDAAKAKGVYKGRPATIEAAKVRELRAQGLGASAIAKRLKIGRASVYRLLGP